jgi:uncharacterized protein
VVRFIPRHSDGPLVLSYPGRTLVLVARLMLMLVAWCVSAEAYTPPPIRGHVTDMTGKLSPADITELNAKLSRFRAETTHEVAILLIPSLGGESIEDVAYDTFKEWKIGQKGADNGVLLVIAPGDRKVRIETGKGIGGALTDLQASQIIRTKIGPRLKEEKFREALEDGSDAILEALKSEPGAAKKPPPAELEKARKSELLSEILGMLFGVFFVFGIGGWVLWNAMRGSRKGVREGCASGGTTTESRSGSDYSSSSSDYSSSSSDYSSSSSDSSYSGGGGESGGGGSSDSY